MARETSRSATAVWDAGRGWYVRLWCSWGGVISEETPAWSRDLREDEADEAQLRAESDSVAFLKGWA